MYIYILTLIFTMTKTDVACMYEFAVLLTPSQLVVLNISVFHFDVRFDWFFN